MYWKVRVKLLALYLLIVPEVVSGSAHGFYIAVRKQESGITELYM
jgi:hypothetical protein